ncbi:MAG TPA: protein kinase [Trichormus sp.]
MNSPDEDLSEVTHRLNQSQRITIAADVDESGPEGADQFTSYVADPLVGKTLDGGRYHILSVLGRGGMSVVYKARQELVDRPVAIKTLTCQLLGDPVVLKRFQREIRALSKLSHPNIVSAFDCVVDSSGQPYFIMDFLDGESLAELLYDEGALAQSRVRRLFLQVCNAVSHAHNLQVLHRDLKPANIMLINVGTPDELAKVVDFGLAKLSEDAQKLTVTGEVWGSPSYMSPEQVYGKTNDSRSDIYSIGCVMFEALTGRAPFQGATPIDTVMMQVNAKPPSFAEANPGLDIHPSLEAIVMSCIQKNPDERFQTMNDVATALQEVDLDSPPPIRAPRPKPPDPSAPSLQMPTEKRLPATGEFEPTQRAPGQPKSFIGRPAPSPSPSAVPPVSAMPSAPNMAANQTGSSGGAPAARTGSGAPIQSSGGAQAPQVMRPSRAMRSGTSQNNQRSLITAMVIFAAVFGLSGLAATFYFLGREGGPETRTGTSVTPQTGTAPSSATGAKTTQQAATGTPPQTQQTSPAVPQHTGSAPPTVPTSPQQPITTQSFVPTNTATSTTQPFLPTNTTTSSTTQSSLPTNTATSSTTQSSVPTNTATPPTTRPSFSTTSTHLTTQPAPPTHTAASTKSKTVSDTKNGATAHHSDAKPLVAKSTQPRKPKHHEHAGGNDAGSTYVPAPVDDAQRWYDIQKSWSH